jgi:2-polyprenyl-6-hydroxyphenyl methylase/3-demethylubiquinone-9 3-methyltransferase
MINVDPIEIEKFSELAHRWWDPGAEFRPLHEINPLRLEHIDRIAGLKDKLVLDVGCGGGILAESMAARGARVTGIDLAEKPLKVAQLHLLESGEQVDYRLVAPEALAEELPGLRGARAAGRAPVLFHDQPQSQVVSLRGRRR